MGVDTLEERNGVFMTENDAHKHDKAVIGRWLKQKAFQTAAAGTIATVVGMGGTLAVGTGLYNSDQNDIDNCEVARDTFACMVQHGQYVNADPVDFLTEGLNDRFNAALGRLTALPFSEEYYCAVDLDTGESAVFNADDAHIASISSTFIEQTNPQENSVGLCKIETPYGRQAVTAYDFNALGF